MVTIEIPIDNNQILAEQVEHIISETVFVDDRNTNKIIQKIADTVAKIGIFLIMLFVYFNFIK